MHSLKSASFSPVLLGAQSLNLKRPRHHSLSSAHPAIQSHRTILSSFNV